MTDRHKAGTLKAWVHVLLSTLLSWGVMCLVFPDLAVRHAVSFIRFADSEFNYCGVFAFLTNAYHGGIQLWSPYDQMPLAFYYLTGGMVTFGNVMFAGLYAVLSPLFDSPAEAYHTLYSIAYTIPSGFVRAAGCYLLLRRFIRSDALLLVLTVYGGTLLAPHYYLGLNCANLYSFFPLLVHFALRMFERPNWTDLSLTLLVATVCVSGDALVGVGYFYQGVHLTLVPMAVWALTTRRRQEAEASVRDGGWRGFALIAGLCALMILPWIYMLMTNYGDYEVMHDKTRFVGMRPFSPASYLSRSAQYAPQPEFLMRIINFRDNRWGDSWLFLGYGVVASWIIGAFVSKDRRRHIFIAAGLLFYLVNSPRQFGWTPSGVAHWINATTNPFAFVARSFHMTGAFLLPWVVLPVAAMGLQALFGKDGGNWIRRGLACAALAGFTFCAGRGLGADVRSYLQLGLVLSVLLIVLSGLGKVPRRLRVSLLVLMIAVMAHRDASAMSEYMRQVSDQVRTIPHHFKRKRPPTFLDAQNPKILPYRDSYNREPLPTIPGYLLVDPINMQGVFYRYVNLRKFFAPLSEYRPRHRSYSALSSDPEVRGYVESRSELVARAVLAVPDEPDTLARIVRTGRQYDVIVVDRPAPEPYYTTQWPEALPRASFPREPERSEIRLWHDGRPTMTPEGLRIYHYPLPAQVPKWLASGIFSEDRHHLEVACAGRKLVQAQGRLTLPFSYDLRNLRSDHLSVAWIGRDEPREVILRYPVSGGGGAMINIRFSPDRLSYDYRMPWHGWMLMHYPYDPKWRLSVDGEVVPVYRANRCFMAVPLGPGEHRIDWVYWPGTPLRPLIALSVAISVVCTFGAITVGFKRG